MIWATPDELRAQLDDIPADDTAAQQLIDRAVRSLTRIIVRWPALDDTDRAADETVRADTLAAVAETVRHQRLQDDATNQLGGLGGVIAAGGQIDTATLRVSGGTGSRAGLGDTAPRLPLAAIDALASANLIGGSVPAW